MLRAGRPVEGRKIVLNNGSEITIARVANYIPRDWSIGILAGYMMVEDAEGAIYAIFDHGTIFDNAGNLIGHIDPIY